MAALLRDAATERKPVG